MPMILRYIYDNIITFLIIQYKINIKFTFIVYEYNIKVLKKYGQLKFVKQTLRVLFV